MEKYSCSNCTKTFASSQSLNAHKRSHTTYKEEPALCCALISKQVIAAKSLEQHIQSFSKRSTTCKHCSSIFIKTTKNQMYCSKSCSTSSVNTGVQRNLKSGRYAVKACLRCGSNTTNAKYCSTACKSPYNSEAERLRNQRAMKREAWQRYQARKKNQTVPGEDISKIQDFYNKCPEGYEVDHIIPLSKGGLHTLSNLQYLTISENRKKSNKL